MGKKEGKVYIVSPRASKPEEALLPKIEKLLEATGITKFVPEEATEITKFFLGKGMVAIKLQIGELGSTRYLRPLIVRQIANKVIENGTIPLITDSTSFGGGTRFWGPDLLETAKNKGFPTGDPNFIFRIADGYTATDGDVRYIKRGNEINIAEVSGEVLGSQAMIVLSHVTGHPFTCISGAIVNLGLGCTTKKGKHRIYSILKPKLDESKCDKCGHCERLCIWGAIKVNETVKLDEEKCRGCGDCALFCPKGAFAISEKQKESFQRRTADAAAVVAEAMANKVAYINFLMDVTPQPDEYPYSDVPIVPDQGILASTDPVAIDAASLDLINKAPGIPGSMADDYGVIERGAKKLETIYGISPYNMLKAAENVGLGNLSYELINCEG